MRTVLRVCTFIAYWQATLNYLLLTGDGARFTNIDHHGDYSTVAEFFQSMYASETGWVIGSGASDGSVVDRQTARPRIPAPATTLGQPIW